jgi:2-methylcitrate dehydratase PrpD
VSIESDLLDFVQGLKWRELPPEVRGAVMRLSADAIANAVSGRRASDVPALEAATIDLYGLGASSIIAGGVTSLAGAVGLNAFQITVNTMCDVYRPGLCHITPEVVPAALGIGEVHDVRGEALLTAIAAGLEATARLCNAFNYPVFRARGWHSPGICGAMGASVTAGLLSGLNGAALAGCFGLAGSQSGGTFAAMGTMAVKFHQLRGAQAAVIAATHARRGLVGSATVLSAPDGGLLRAYSDDPHPELLTEDLGESWHLLEVSTRPYPAASTLQSLINVLLDADVDADVVKAVHIELPEEAYRLGGDAGWESELRAMQSARYVAAGVLLTRSCWTDLFDEVHRNDPVLGAFAAERVQVSRNLDLRDGAVRVILQTDTGDRHLSSDVAQGDPRLPLTDEQLLTKARRCVAGSVLENRSFDVSRLLGLEHESSVARLMVELRTS